MSFAKELEFAPLRPVNDFIMESARFQIPPYKDLEKWNNRIIKNLLYYQSNYFAVVLAVFILVGCIHPRDMILGFGSVALSMAVFLYATSKHPDAVEFKKNHPLVSLGIIVAAGYFLVSVLGSVVVFAFGIALPLLLMFLHASLRMRNLKNMVAGKLEQMGLKKTPMGQLLTILGVDVDIFSLKE